MGNSRRCSTSSRRRVRNPLPRRLPASLSPAPDHGRPAAEKVLHADRKDTFNSDSPQFVVPEKLVSAAPLNITRLFFCREDYVPTAENPKCFEPCKVNLWIPVKEGPCAQAVPPAGEKTAVPRRLQPTRPLPDGVYCLHTGVLANSQPRPSFCSLFVVRGYGIPQIEKAVVELRATDVKLILVVRNLGLGEFNDGFVVATIQKQEGSRFESQGRRHLDIEPIPAKGDRQIESIWKIADFKPGKYHFHGAINYKELWDPNKLATFDTDLFVIGSASKAGNCAPFSCPGAVAKAPRASDGEPPLFNGHGTLEGDLLSSPDS